METLKSKFNILLTALKSHTSFDGEIFFNNIDASNFCFTCRDIEKHLSEFEKIENYNNSAAHYCPPEGRRIKGKAPQDKFSAPVSFKSDNVNHPSHYTWLKDLCGIEPIDITRHMGFSLGNAIKYILRSGHKTEKGMSEKEKQIEDLQKAIFYLNDEINQLKNSKTR